MKKYLKKSLSTFLALLMVFTSLVFVVPEIAPEAEAASNSYSYSVTVARSKNGGGSDSSAYIRVYYYTINASGNLTGGTAYANHDLSSVTSSTAVKYTGTTAGWPYKVEIYTADEDSNNEDLILSGIEVAGKTVLSGTWTIDQGSTRTFAYNSATGDDGIGSPDIFDWPEPNLSIDWEKTAAAAKLTVPYSGTVYSTKSPAVAAIDTSYDVSWNNLVSFCLSNDSAATNKGTTMTGISIYNDSGTEDYARQVAVTNAAKSYIAANANVADGEHYVSVYVHAYIGDNITPAPYEVEITNVVYDANFENLFSLNSWYAANTFPSGLGVTIDQLNGKLTLKNNGTSGELTAGRSYQIPVTAGKTYTLEYTRGEDTSTDMYLFFNDSTDSSVFNDTVNRLTVDAKGTYSKEFTVPSGVTFVTIRFDANTPGETYTFTNVRFYETARRENVTISEDRIPVYGHEAVGELPTATKKGYTFNGWYTGEDGTGTPVTAETLVDSGVTYYAKWIPTVNCAEFYDYDGQLYKTVSGDYATKISAVQPAAPASFTNEAGTYVFYRWVNMDTGAVLGDEVFDSEIENEVVAKYKAEYKKSGTMITYTATFVNPYDASYTGSVSGYFNQSLSTPANPTRASEQIDGVDAYDYDFIGWALSKDGEVVIKPGNTFRILDDVTYYACFEQKLAQHTVTTVYGTNAGGANAGSGSYTAGYSEWVELPNPSEWRDTTNSYVFSHWVDSKGNEYTPSGKTVMVRVLGPETYTAVYDALPVRYHAYFYNGTEQLVDQELSYNEYVTVPEIEAPTKDRVGNTTYEFDGWYLYDVETNTWGEKLENNKFLITGDDYTFYAKYNEIKWSTISFLKDADNDYELIADAKEYVWDAEVTVPEAPTKKSTVQYDYEFTGWTAYPSGEFYEAGEVITAPHEDTYYIATYEATLRTYTVTFYNEDGVTVIGEPQTVEYGSTPVAPADPTKDSTDRYTYTFDGWSNGARIYTANELPEVEGDATYTAVFTGKDVYYPVHWLTPTADGTYSDNTVNYTYNRIITMPATTPSLKNDVEKEGYTWGFTGWYLADVNGNLVDAEGNMVESIEDGVQFVKGIHIRSALYYVATFGYIADEHTVEVYDDNGELLKTYRSAYNEALEVTNFEKDAVLANHYVLKGFATTKGGDVVYTADTVTDGDTTILDGTTTIIVDGDLKLYAVYEAESHTWGDWITDVEATYAEVGSKHRICEACNYKATLEIDKLKDETAPAGQVTIGGNSWTNEYVLDLEGEPDYNYNRTAYVRDDAIISILTTDVGNGIKSIKYTWSDGTTHTYNVANEFDTAVNYNFSIPEGFAGKYLNVVITDYVGKTYKIQTATLQVDDEAPNILVATDCLWFGFMIEEAHEIDEIKVTDADGIAVAYTEVVTDDNKTAYVVGSEEAPASGKYTITVTDKAGNAGKAVAEVVGKHVSSDWIVDTDATCTADGAKHKECTACATVLEEAKIDALGHDEENAYWVIDTEAACEIAGETSLRCARCEEALMAAPISPLEHEYEADVTEPTCEEGGYTTHTCKLCGVYYTDSETPKLDHDMEVSEEAEPTCLEAGYTVYKCSRCDYTETKDGDPALNHPEDQCETIVIKSECTGSSITKVVCKLCGEVVEQTGDLSGHDFEVKETVVPTCTTDGYTVKECSKCEAEITIVDRLSRTGHTWNTVYTTDKAATCTEAGSESIHCSACKETKNAKEIPALGHNLVLDEESYVEATCNTDGYKKEECSRCDYYVETTIEATGEHNFSIHDEEASYAATCTEAGLNVYKCGGTDCTATNEVVIPATGHEKDEKVSETAGTCQVKATITYGCKNCDATITEEGSYGSHKASSTLVKTTKAATCTTDGDGIFKCEYCDATVVANGGIKALGHDYKKVVTDATCTEDGYTTYTCSRCGNTYTDDEVEATGEHTWETEYRIIDNATCTVNGRKAIYCSVCSLVKEGSEVIVAATGHTDGDWITDKKATCTENGSKHIECTVCGTTTKTEAIASNGGHIQGALVKTNTPATCSTEGVGVYKCTACGETYVGAIPVDEDNHSYSAWSTVDATCTDEGYKIKTCTNKDASGKVCSAEIKKTIAAKGHSYSLTKEEVVEDGGNFVTKITYTCSRCNGTYTDTTETTAYLVTIVDMVNGNNSSVILKDGAKLRKIDLPEIDLPEDSGETTYVLKWVDSNGNELSFPMNVTSNTTIYAKAEGVTKTYTVEFVNNAGKIISSAEYTYGAEVAVPEDQVLLNHTFLGWSDGVNTYDAENIPAVTGDATYYADFQANAGIKTYYVTYKSDTGSKTIYTQTVLEGGKATAPETVPTKANNSVYHYVFAGWYTATEGGSAYDFSSTVSANITVYARFNAVKHSEDADYTSTSATCSDPASKAYTCNTCGYEWITYTDPATGHTYKEADRTTTADGKVMVTYICSVCGDEWTKTVTQGMADSNAIIVTVTDTSGNPVEGASVAIYLGELKVTAAVTNEKGKAYFAKDVVSDGSYRVNVSKDGYDDLSGTLVVKDGKGTVKLSSFSITECHCVCHADSFFGNIRRWFTNLLRSIFKNYTCCDCGNMGYIY